MKGKIERKEKRFRLIMGMEQILCNRMQKNLKILNSQYLQNYE